MSIKYNLQLKWNQLMQSAVVPIVSENGGQSHCSVFLLSSVCAQFSSAPRACVSGHRTSGKGAIYLCVGLLHRPDRVHPEGHAHTWHCLSCLRPRWTGKHKLLWYCDVTKLKRKVSLYKCQISKMVFHDSIKIRVIIK